jgi:hypothetical protein
VAYRCADKDADRRLLLAVTVEKGKNEPIKNFACTPVETGFS